jgi:dolichol-phosphate mannosyltransferase
VTADPEGVLVILPTLDEGSNIEPLLDRIAAALEGRRYSVCVVDDGSKDGTREKVRAYANPRMPERPVLIERERRRGFGSQRWSAVAAGLAWGLAHTEHGIFVEMDADLSHRPEELPGAIAALRESPAEVVILSKYLPGSGVVERLWVRRLLSTLANLAARLLIDPSVKDYSNGYRLYSRSAVEVIVKTGVRHAGPIALSESLALLMGRGMRVVEVPSTYVGRATGTSKLELADIVKAMLALVAIGARYHATRFASRGREQWGVRLMAIAIVVSGILWAFFTRRPQDMDELGLLNPPYMLAHLGKLTYPAHSQHDALTVHPPTHYLAVGLALKALPAYYAEALPAFLFLLVAVLVIYRSVLPQGAKVGLLFASLGTWLLHGYASFDDEVVHFGFGVRPELHMTLAWLAGLVALENGRLLGWSRRWLALGGALVTYASTIHYPATFAWVGALVYVPWAIRSLPRRAWLGPVGAIAAGAALVGVPYLAFFVLPHASEILHTVRAHGAVGGVGASLSSHLTEYGRHYEHFAGGPLMGVALLPLRLGIPVVLFSTALFVAAPKTRGIGLASLPFLLFVLFCTQGKTNHRGYFMPEMTLYFAALAFAFVAGLNLLARRFLGGRCMTGPASVVLVLWLLAAPILHEADVSLRPRILESSVARWAGKKILGNDALVGTQTTLWYATGAQHYRHVTPDLFWRPLLRGDERAYLASFDAIADGPFRTYAATHEGETIPGWWADGTLSLRGFYFSARNPQLSYVLLAARKRTGPLLGYACVDDQVFAFDGRAGGDHVFVSVTGDLRRLWPHARAARWNGPYVLDADGQGTATFLEPASDFEAARGEIAAAGRIVDEVRGRLLWLGRDADVADLSSDRPMDFPATPADVAACASRLR